MSLPIPLHLPHHVLQGLIDRTREGWFGPKTEAVVCKLIQDWIARSGARPELPEDEHDATPNAVHDASKGYQWKQLFLPNGTELRATFCGKSTYAKVQDEVIISDGAPTTPSRLANASGCGTRNAWRAIWLRFPGDRTWKLAAACRADE